MVCREVVALAREVLGGNGVVADFHVAKQFCDMEAIYTYEVGAGGGVMRVDGTPVMCGPVQVLSQTAFLCFESQLVRQPGTVAVCGCSYNTHTDTTTITYKATSMRTVPVCHPATA